MAYDIIAARGYGSAEDGNATNPATVNHYASITAIDTNAKTITISADDISAFTAGTEILMHISGLRSSSGTKSNIGRYKFAKIMSVSGNTLTLSAKSLSMTVDYYFFQAITVPHYNTLTISETIAPPAFNASTGVGGILVFKAHKLIFSGAINLVGKGLNEDSQRPLLNQEQGGTLDTDTYSGYENYDASYHFTLQKGDGAAMIIAKQIEFESSARIGDPNYHGISRCRNATDSLGRSSELTNVGGSSIVIVAPEIEGWTSYIISKYRRNSLEAGKGLARAYVATESTLTFDEGCYAVDIISTPERLTNETFLSNFGSGINGAASSKDIQQNSYAQVSKITNKTYTLINVDSGGKAKFERGALVMIQATYKNTAAHVGRFFIDTITGVENDNNGKLTAIILNHNPAELDLANFTTKHYNFQAIAIPQYTSYSASNSKTPKFDSGRGGIFAIAVNGTCDLTGKTIDVMKKGGSKYYSQVSNAGMRNRLPIGEGHGSVFILAKMLKVNSSTRLGATYTGNAFGGGNYNPSNEIQSDGGYLGKRTIARPLKSYYGYGGGGYRGGQQEFGHNGGYFSNSTDGAPQGASLFIVAETLDGLCLDCLSTGGQRGSQWRITSSYSGIELAGKAGGCGYGGAGCGVQDSSKLICGAQGGVHGGGAGASNSTDSDWSGGGGSSGFCVVYANKVTNQSTANILLN